MLKRLKAGEDPLELSIQKWQDIVDGKGEDDGSENCALCEVYDCSNCIITKEWETRCSRTPYAEYKTYPTRENALKELVFLQSLRKK